MTVLFTIPQTILPIGARTFVTPTIPAGVTEYIVRLQQIAWPHLGDKAFNFSLDLAVDQVFSMLCSGDVIDLSVPARGAKLLDQFAITVGPLPGVGITTRRLRLSLDMAKSLTMSGTLEVA